MSEDKELWLLFKAGDKQAFASLFRNHHRALIQYGRKISPDTDGVQDCIQELFLELWQSRERIAEVVSVKAYLFGALKLKLLKLESTYKLKSDLSEQEDMLYEFSYEAILSEEQADFELKQRLLRAIQQLSKRQQEAIYLKYYSKMSYEEISVTMSINYQASRNLVYQAVKALREHLLFAILCWVLLKSA